MASRAAVQSPSSRTRPRSFRPERSPTTRRGNAVTPGKKDPRRSSHALERGYDRLPDIPRDWRQGNREHVVLPFEVNLE